MMASHAESARLARWCFTVWLITAYAGAAGADPPPAPDRMLALEGSNPRGFFELPDGGIAFATSGDHGSSTVVHALGSAGESVIAVLEPGRVPFAVNDDFILAENRGFFEVSDVHSGRKLKRKRFEQFVPPAPGAHSYWLDGNVLTLIQNESYPVRSTMRRIRLPDLVVTERTEAPVVGAYTRWKVKFVAVGYWSADERLPAHTAVTILDSSFRVSAHSEIAPSTPRNNQGCDWAIFARPHVMGDLLVYGSDCGGVRVHDLRTMQQVAARGPLGDALGLSFASSNGRLWAVGNDRDGLTVNEVALPSLQPSRVLRLVGAKFAVSGSNVYSIEGNGLINVSLYRVGQLAPPHSLSDSIVHAQQAAAAVLQGPDDVDEAINSMKSAIPLLTSSDVQSVTPAARTALAWYSGLLVQAPQRSQEATRLLDALRDASAQDARISRLDAAARTWTAILSPARDAPTLPSRRSTFTSGALNGVVARTDRYLVVGRWCGTVDQRQNLQTGSGVDYTDAAEALNACFDGTAGLAIHAANDQRFVRFIPITSSDGVRQEYISDIAVLGDTALVGIGRRYADDASDALVAVDLRSGKRLAHGTRVLQPRVISGKFFGCEESECTELDPATLEPLPGQPAVTLRDGSAHDGRLQPVRIAGSPYQAGWRASFLEVRDASGNFVCAWPGLVAENAFVTTLLFNPGDRTLLIGAAAKSRDDVTPSASIDGRTLVSRSRECAQRTRSARDALDEALRALGMPAAGIEPAT